MKISKLLFAASVIGLFFNSCSTPKKTIKESGQAADTIPLNEVTISANLQYKGFATKYFRLIRTELDLRPDWKKHYIYGQAAISLQAYAYPQDTLTLDAVGFIINKVDLKPFKGETGTAIYRYDNKKLYISMGKPAAPGETFNVYIDYIACPDSVMSKKLKKRDEFKGFFFIKPENKDSLKPRELYTQGETQSNSCWFPTIDAPDQKMTQKIKLTIDSQYVTLSNGELISSQKNNDGTRTDVWEQKLPHAPYLAMLAAGPWVVVHDSWKNMVPVNYYIEKEYAPYAHLNFGKTPEMIEYYSKILNYSFVWDKYSQVVVRDYDGGAMENTGAVLFFEKMNQDTRMRLDEDLEDVISHELFHHWFGDLVTCKSWSNIALNESFATYGEYLWRDHKYGAQEAGFYMNEDLKKYLEEANYNQQPIIYHYYYDQEDLFDRTRYQKGGLVLVMLRNYLGERVFYNALHNYLVNYAFKTAEIADLRHAFEDASGEDLNWFFSEWFEKPGQPDFEISHNYNNANQTITLTVNQTQTGAQVPVYRMPVDIDVYLPGNKTLRKKIWLENKKDTFSFSVGAKPLLVNFDASKTLVCRKKEYKDAAEWYYQYFHAPLVIDRTEALASLTQKNIPGRDSVENVVAAGLKDSFWATRQMALQAVYKSLPEDYYALFKDQIHGIAANDPRASVRASALNIIQAKEKDGAKKIFERALADSSYLVISTALSALEKNLPASDSAWLLTAAAKDENLSRSDDVMLQIAKIYGRYGDASKLSFMHKASYLIPSYELSDYIESYEEFIQNNGWQILEKDLYFVNHLGDRLDNFMDKLGYKEMLRRLGDDMQKIKDKTSNDSDVSRLDAIIGFLQKRRDIIKFSAEQ